MSEILHHKRVNYIRDTLDALSSSKYLKVLQDHHAKLPQPFEHIMNRHRLYRIQSLRLSGLHTNATNTRFSSSIEFVVQGKGSSCRSTSSRTLRSMMRSPHPAIQISSIELDISTELRDQINATHGLAFQVESCGNSDHIEMP